MTAPEFDRTPFAASVLLATGAAIRAARESAGMTQEALGAALDVTQTAVSYWEAGKRDPGVADLLRIAEALSVHPASLLPVPEPEAVPEPTSGKLAHVEVKGFRDLGVVRVSESVLGGVAMLRAESADGAVAEFPASSLHFITWLPEGATEADVRRALPAGAAHDVHDGFGDRDGWDGEGPW